MGLPSDIDATSALAGACAGDGRGAAQLVQMVYDELRRIAAGFLGQERAGHTLQPTALVHEAYLRLVDQTRVSWQGRTHFIGVAAEAMRRILVDHARARGAKKRGGDWTRVTADPECAVGPSRDVDVLALDEALTRLTALNSRHGRIVELRFFGGLSIEETAGVIGLGTTAVEEGWSVARAWLRRELAKESRV